ncbi:c-type cytochrome [Caballeronia sp. LZ032]|jgi:cytochrome c oxidase subunit 2|uniref:cytochrome c oxidase subunit II n=1 Tax=Caballeronia sp. LZ032 TaxID=3038565 RepID=UPI002857A4F8|nr:c-type cytochrome [Caballeronia sp. LZ032]MDR5883527.1 c-type cytochrome [Caballeronia sp. LZ032]
MQTALFPAGVQAGRILELWHLTLAVCCAVFAAILLACLIAIVRAPRANRATPVDLSSIDRPQPRTRLWVVAATGVSTLLLLGLLLADVMTDRALSRLPVDDALRIEMTGYQWWWQAKYLSDENAPEFTLANELHVPVGRPVIISLKAADVIHTFWVPNLHGKKDMIPGRDATIEFRADKAGVYRGQCAEFCGYEHALMAFSITADPPARYAAWAAQQRQPAAAPVDALALHGRDVFISHDCARCHTVRGTDATGTIGPDLTHLASREFIAAGTLPNNRGNLAGWIVDPRTLKPGTIMPGTRLPPADLQALLVWLETLK